MPSLRAVVCRHPISSRGRVRASRASHAASPTCPGAGLPALLSLTIDSPAASIANPAASYAATPASPAASPANPAANIASPAASPAALFSSHTLLVDINIEITIAGLRELVRAWGRAGIERPAVPARSTSPISQSYQLDRPDREAARPGCFDRQKSTVEGARATPRRDFRRDFRRFWSIFGSIFEISSCEQLDSLSKAFSA